jgi:hypothetical protein
MKTTMEFFATAVTAQKNNLSLVKFKQGAQAQLVFPMKMMILNGKYYSMSGRRLGSINLSPQPLVKISDKK